MLDFHYSLSKMMCPTVRQIYLKGELLPMLNYRVRTISVYTREDDVSQAPAAYSLCGVLWFMRIQRGRCLGRFDRAKSASSRASITHELAF